jgi:formyltetrahydrofolate deformylase
MTIPTYVLTLICDDKKGIVAAVGNSIAAQGGNILESGQYVDEEKNRFFMRVCFSLEDNKNIENFKSGFEPVALAYAMDCKVHDLSIKPRVLIMVSKLGHCLNDLLYRNSINQLPMELVAVVSNHTNWQARVEYDKIPFYHMPVTPENKNEQEEKLLNLVDEKKVDLVILARYMQILTDELSSRLYGNVINIHHSFLPSFKGARPYHQAHARGVKLIGATAHYVTPDLDEGPIIDQGVHPVSHSTTPKQMVAIGRDTESQVLARAIKYHLEHRILLNDDRTVIFH